MKTGTFPRLKVAQNNQREGGQQPHLLGFHLIPKAGATQEPNMETERSGEAQGPRLLSGLIQDSPGYLMFAQETPLERGLRGAYC